MSKQHYRTVWISDIHLGSTGCKSEHLENFLSSFKSDTIYLVGDIIDGWKLGRKKSYFPQEHVNIIRKLLSKARKGTVINYVIGNHDDLLYKYVDFELSWGNIHIRDEYVHITADGRKILVIHGHQFDAVTLYHTWIAKFGDVAYDILLDINTIYNKIRNVLGLKYWSLSAYIKHQVKHAVTFINKYEEMVSKECKERGFDGVVCGHIHHAEIKEIDGITYYNDGDFVESCTALVEHFDGKMELVYWHNINHEDNLNNED